MKKVIYRSLFILALLVPLMIAQVLIFKKRSSQLAPGMPIEQYEAEKKALLVIDVQESTTGSMSADDYYISHADSLIHHINVHIDSAVAQGIPVIYIRNEVSDWFINLLDKSYKPGSEGVKFDKRLKIVDGPQFPKHRQDAFINPDLNAYLVKNKINHLLITGLDLSYCIKSTVISAKGRKYEVTVLEDAVIAENDSLKAVVLEEFGKGGVWVTSDE